MQPKAHQPGPRPTFPPCPLIAGMPGYQATTPGTAAAQVGRAPKQPATTRPGAGQPTIATVLTSENPVTPASWTRMSRGGSYRKGRKVKLEAGAESNFKNSLNPICRESYRIVADLPNQLYFPFVPDPTRRPRPG